jgi:hypothetical protein
VRARGRECFFPLALDTSDKNPDDWSVDHTCSPGWMVFALSQLASALLHLFLSRSVFHENFCKDSNFFGFHKMREIKAKCEFFPLKIRVIYFLLDSSAVSIESVFTDFIRTLCPHGRSLTVPSGDWSFIKHFRRLGPTNCCSCLGNVSTAHPRDGKLMVKWSECPPRSPNCRNQYSSVDRGEKCVRLFEK